MKARLTSRTVVYVHCPNCGAEDGRIEDLLAGTLPTQFGPWPCSECGRKYSGTITSPDHVEIEMEAG